MTQAQLMYRICHQNLRPPTEGLPIPLAQLVEECWNAIPEMRPSFPEIIIRLHRLETLIVPEEGGSGHTVVLGELVPHRNVHTYTTFHEMIAPEAPPEIVVVVPREDGQVDLPDTHSDRSDQ